MLFRGFPLHHRFLFSSRPATAQFISSFDAQCKMRIETKLNGWPLTLQMTNDYGSGGLFATRALQEGETILSEVPTLSTCNRLDTTHIEYDPRVMQAVKNVPLAWQSDVSLVAQAVCLASRSNTWPASSSLLRCLGYTEDDSSDSRFVKTHVFEQLTKAFDLVDNPEWNPDECKLVYDKIKSNYFDSAQGASVFEACSMLNHFCVGNVEFNQFKSNDLVAVQPVETGEQLFISYMVEDAAPDLPELYGFTCRCEQCRGK